MNTSGFQESKDRHDAMARYARLYAQHRTLPFLVQMGVFFGLFAAVFGSALGTVYAGRTGNPFLIVCAVAALIAVAGIVIWVSVPRWGGRHVWRFGLSLYGGEGQASVEEFSKIKWPWWGYLLVPALVVELFVQYGLTSAGWLPVRLAQPISMPFIAALWILFYRIQRPAVGAWMLLAPALAVLYALAVLVGAPLAYDDFSKFWVNVYVPMFGAQILSMIAGHVYSRYALRKVKALAQLDAAETRHD
jgi:hypothetical protein